MPGYLTTHVLDTAKGCPAAGIPIDLYRIQGQSRDFVRSLVTNSDGRTDQHILPENEFEIGEYELVFRAGDYISSLNDKTENPLFLSDIPIRFGMSEASHYHVPLLLSPFGYSTYRGS
jgi:5-hydroxyisourate hydrolase